MLMLETSASGTKRTCTLASGPARTVEAKTGTAYREGAYSAIIIVRVAILNPPFWVL